MLSKKIFSSEFKDALKEELKNQKMSIKELAERTKIPKATLYKICSGDRDPKLSTVKKIVRVLENKEENFIAILAAKFLLDELDATEYKINKKTYKIKEYPCNTMDECIVSTVRAEKEGAMGIICAPILSSIVEKLVDIPVVIIRPKKSVLDLAIKTLLNKISSKKIKN